MNKPRPTIFGWFASSRNYASSAPPMDGDLYGYRGRAQALRAARVLWDRADPMQRRLALADDARTVPGAPPIEKRNLTQEAQLATAHALLQAAQNAADQPGAAQPAQSYNPRAPQRSYPRAPIPSKGRTPQSPPPSRVPKLTLPQTPPPAPEPPATTMDGAKRQSENQLHNWRAYFNELAFQESSGDPKAKNTTAGGIGAHGLAQLRLPAFRDIDYIIVNDEHDGTKKEDRMDRARRSGQFGGISIKPRNSAEIRRPARS